MSKATKIIAGALGVAATIATGGAFLAFGTTVGVSIFGVSVGALSTAAAGASIVAGLFTGPQGTAAVQARQASITSLTIGEVPREAVFGTACTAGSLVDGFNYGGTNGTDWEALVIAIADHQCDALVGYYVGDTYYAYDGDPTPAWSKGAFEIHVRFEAGIFPDAQHFPLIEQSAGTWTAADTLDGVSYVVVAYRADEAIFPQGRPTFRFVVRGKRLYDPRKDDTQGGVGPHRWLLEGTREWDDNAELCRYNYDRGIFAAERVTQPEQLLLGRGLSHEEAGGDLVAIHANICDELVAKPGGGTEKRYTANGVIRANQPFVEVAQMFADTTGGQIIQPEGGVAVEPGYARAKTFNITDADLVVGEPIVWNDTVSTANRVNTVVARYVEPTQGWVDTAAPIARVDDDIRADRGPQEETLSLPLVTSVGQAQRLAEIRRRKARLEKSGSLVLPPRLCQIEEGDWGTYTSSRRTGGQPLTVRVQASSLNEAWRNSLSLEEISADVYAAPALQEGAGAPIVGTPPAIVGGDQGARRPTSIGPEGVVHRLGPGPVASSQISVIAHTAYFGDYPQTIIVPAETIVQLAENTEYGVFYRDGAGFEVEPRPATTHMTTGRWYFIGWQFTADAGTGEYPSRPTPPPGSGGDGAYASIE